MTISVSNIAWPAELDREAIRTLRTEGVDAMEVAPTKIWPNWDGIDPRSVSEIRRLLESEGLRVSTLQSILFQKPDLHLFGSEQQKEDLRAHLRVCADIATGLGAESLVFGAPKNRLKGQLSEEEAFSAALDFFSGVAGYFAERNIALVFEANPKDYACTFATESATAARLVRAVDSPGFRLHLDLACMTLAGENVDRQIAQNADILRHFHASEPFLASFDTPSAPHERAAGALRDAGYRGWVALEMRAGEPAVPALATAIRYVRNAYGV